MYLGKMVAAMSEQLLLSLRTIMVLMFNGSFLFILSDFKCGMKKAAQYLLILFFAVGCINFAIMLVFGWRSIESVCVFTIVIPIFLCLCFLSKDGFWKTTFNFCLQLNIFFILYFISSLSIYLFHMSILTDMFLRLFYFAGLLFFHIKYSRKKFREFAMYINTGWSVLALLSVIITALFMLYIFNVMLDYQNPLTYTFFALFCLLAVGIYIVMYITFKNTYDLMLKSQTEQSMKLQIALQKEQYSAAQSKIEADITFRHDLRHHANLLTGMLNEGRPDDALRYVQKLGTLALDRVSQYYCENLVVNTILAHHVERARVLGFAVDCKAVIPEKIDIDEMELCTALSNLLENAVEHCTGNPPYLTISILQNKEQLCIRIQNSFDGIVKRDKNGEYHSTKPQGGGIGLRSVAAIVKKYKGAMNVSHTQTTFTVDIAMKA